MDKKNFGKIIRIMIFNENGDIDAIFCLEDEKENNTIHIPNTDNISCIKELTNFQKTLIDKEGDENFFDRHLFYLKRFLRNNYQKEFAEKRIRPLSVMDDTLLYYYLTRINKVIIINSNDHINLLCAPREGMNELQAEKLEIIKNLFNDHILWELADDMHIERYEDNPKQGYLEIGETKRGYIDKILDNLKLQISQKQKKDNKTQ